MKSITSQQMESIEGGSKLTTFCLGFQAGEMSAGAAVAAGLIAAPPIGAAMAVVLGAINLACIAAEIREFW